MTFHFARLQGDGRLTSPMPKAYASAKEAMDDAPQVLRGKPSMHGGKVVLVQVIAEVAVSFKTEFRDAKTQKEFTGKP